MPPTLASMGISGELLRETEKNKGMAGGGKRTASGTFTEPLDTTPTLASLGIDKKLSSRAQSLSGAL